MESVENKRHWQSWAEEHGTSVRATTMSETAKALEIEALTRQLAKIEWTYGRILEAGCGNGINCVELTKRFPRVWFHGIDYAPEMVAAAKKNAEAAQAHNARFAVGDVLNLSTTLTDAFTYDVVFTCRCLINLPSFEKQKGAIAILASKVRPGGTLLMIENLVEGRERQNRFRELLGLEARPLMPPFNKFFQVFEMEACIENAGLELVEVEHFSSLHDLMLYVLNPGVNAFLNAEYGTTVDYNDPLVKIAAELSIKSPSTNFGNFGQNVLFICRKP